ncbi:MAG: glycosyltransferase [Ruthenibacterium sp.]
MQNKESNFISAVAYVYDDALHVAGFLQRVQQTLEARFDHYEIIMVNDASRDGSVQEIKKYVRANAAPVTLINMSLAQGRELCMNAGMDAAIGDFVFEFDTLDTGYDAALLCKAYETALTGYDIVSVGPAKNRNFVSSLFYRVFNASSHSRYKLQTDVLRLLSRRAINRVHAVSATPAYRKAAYAASGLKLFALCDKSIAAGACKDKSLRLTLAVDSLALYTDTAYRVSFGVAALMLLGTVAELIYTLSIYFGGTRPVEGWTTMMFVLTVGFFGVFAILTFVLKYLSLLVDLLFKHQKYLVESVEKL